MHEADSTLRQVVTTKIRKLGYLSGAPRTSTKPFASLTGGRQHILGTIDGFRANGWSVQEYIVGDKVPEHWLRAEHEMNKGKSFLQRLVADVLRILLQVVHVSRAIKDIGPVDWVYERYAAYQIFGYFFQRAGIPWILETNDAIFRQARNELKHVALPSLVRWAEKFAYRSCDILVVISDDLKRIIVEQLGISASKIVVVPNAADTSTFNPEGVVPQRRFEEATFVIGWQGAMYKWAGLELLVRAVATMRAQGMNVGAVLLGDGHERKSLEALAIELGCADWIAFCGRVSRELVPSYIAGYDICYSGQVNWTDTPMYLSPLKLYDYMAMGKPVIASRFADAANLTKDGELGYLFVPGDVGDLVTVATRAHNERAKLSAMGNAARAEILANHTWTRRVAAFIQTAEGLLAEPTIRSHKASPTRFRRPTNFRGLS